MPDETAQKAAHRFFSTHLQTQAPFTKEDLGDATEWSTSALNTYWSKQFKGILEPIDDKHFRVKESFRRYIDWKKFKNLVTQVKTVPPSYAPQQVDDIIVYEFYIPLAHEQALRQTLDSLFYKDAIIARLNRIGIPVLRKLFEVDASKTDHVVLERACDFVERKFGGYSIYHVDGRFRSGRLATQQEAADLQKAGQPYLANETTAVTRFIFPCQKGEPNQVRVLFKELFTNSVTELISGEDEIWVVESGLRSGVEIWKPIG